MSLAKKLFSGSAIRLTHLFLEIIIGFLLMPFLVSELTEKWYGLWLLVASITGFFTLLTLGLSSAVQRYLSYEISANQIVDYKKTISSSILIFTLAAIACILIALTIGYSSSLFIDDSSLGELFSSMVFIVGCNFAIKFFATPFNAALTAEFKFILVSSFEILGFIIKSILTVYFVMESYGVISVAWALLAGEVIANTLIIVFAFKKIDCFRFSYKYIEITKVRELFYFGLNSFIATLGTMLRFPLGNIVISSFVGLSSVTIYSIPVRLLSYADAFILTTLGVLQPFFTKLYAEKKISILKERFFLANFISFGIGGLLAGGLFVFGVDFINLWVKQYEETALLVLILPFSILFGISQHPSIMILYTYGKHKYYAYVNLIEAFVNVLLGLILIQFMGIPGVALGVVLPMLVSKVWLIPKYTCKLLNVPLKRYYRQLIRSYMITLTYTAFWYLGAIEIKSWTDLILWVSIYTVGYGAVYIYLSGFMKPKAMMSEIKKLIANRAR